MLKAEAEAIIDFLILDVLLGIIYFIISSYLYVGEKTIIVMSTIFVVTVPISPSLSWKKSTILNEDNTFYKKYDIKRTRN